MQDGRPRYVTAHGDSNEPAGWRADKATGGVLIEVESGEVVSRGLAMPHSPRLYGDRLWVLDSGAGSIDVVDPGSGKRESIEHVPGFTRGLDFHGQFAFVGLSKIRETSVFGGVPVAEKREELRAGVAVIDLVSGRAVAALQFHTGVDEIFSVNVLPGCVCPVLRGPQPEEDGIQEIWLVPPEGQVPATAPGEVTVPRLTAGPGSDRRLVARAPTPSPVDLGVNEPAPMLAAHTSQPAGPDALFRAGLTVARQGGLSQALDLLKQASTLAPERADILTELGNLYQQLNDQHTALACYRRAARRAPDFVPARQNLGYLLLNHGEPDEAIEHYERALRLQPSPINRLLAATVLPVIYDSVEEVERWRKRLADAVRKLAAEGVTIDTTNALVPTSFFIAYQGQNDVGIARDLGRLFKVDDSPFNPQPEARASHEHRAVASGSGLNERGRTGRIRVAFLSAYFRDHTMGRQNIGRVEHLSRDDFEVTVISVGEHHDEMAQRFRRAADRYIVVPRDVAAARERIAQLDTDVLVFTDVGMDALTYTLAFSRMAPIQCATWGHPDTTGSPAMDYFLSSDLLETDDADAHYTEKLLRLPSLGIYYERPKLSLNPQPEAQAVVALDQKNAFASGLGLNEDRHVYLCPQTLFKFHPEFDQLLAGILERDPGGDLVLIEGRVPNWTGRLKRRFKRTLPGGCERIRFLPAQRNEDFLRLLAAADVILDPPHFGGGNTSYEALAVGTPVVTWPSRYLRGRITAALYRKMKMNDLVVDSAYEYIDLSVLMATEEGQRDVLHRRILENNSVLFEDLNEIRDLEECLKNVVGSSHWVG